MRILAVLGVFFLMIPAVAQDKKPSVYADPAKTIEESLYISRLEREDEKYRKITQNAQELLVLSKELTRISGSEQLKRLEKMEKLAKKIRSEQGGDDGDEKEFTSPANTAAAVVRLQELSEQIKNETARLSRHFVSAVLIENTNELLYLIKIVRRDISK